MNHVYFLYTNILWNNGCLQTKKFVCGVATNILKIGVPDVQYAVIKFDKIYETPPTVVIVTPLDNTPSTSASILFVLKVYDITNSEFVVSSKQVSGINVDTYSGSIQWLAIWD